MQGKNYIIIIHSDSPLLDDKSAYEVVADLRAQIGDGDTSEVENILRSGDYPKVRAVTVNRLCYELGKGEYNEDRHYIALINEESE